MEDWHSFVALNSQVQSVSWVVEATSILLFPFNRKDFELHAEHCCPEGWSQLLSIREEEEEEEGMAQEAHHWKTQWEANTCTPYSFFTLRATRAGTDQYRQMNCAQHSALNATGECLVYRSRSLLTVLVFLASLHAQIHCAIAFGQASLSTPL